MSHDRKESSNIFLILLFGIPIALTIIPLAYIWAYNNAPSTKRVNELETKVAQLSTETETPHTTTTAQGPTRTPKPPIANLIVNAAAANVRAGPSTTYEVLETVLKNHILKGPYSTQQGWHQVCCVDNGKRGWISGELVTKQEPSLAIAPTKTTRTQLPTRSSTIAPIATSTPISSERCMNQLFSGQYQKAIDCYDARIGLFSTDPSDYLNRGVAKSFLGQNAAAIEDYNRVIYLDPTDACAFRNRGLTRVRLGQTQTAYTDFTEAIRIKPDFDEAYTSRGLLLLQEFKQYQNAVTDFNKAISLKGSRPPSSAPRMCSPTPEPNPTPGPTPTPHPCPDLCGIDNESRYITTYLGRAYAYYNLGKPQQSLSDAETALALSRKYGDRRSEASAIELINALR